MRWLIFLFSITGASVALAAEYTLTGTYQGKDLYLRNPFDRATNSFCVQSVSVNGNIVYQNPEVTALHIPLGKWVAKGESVRISITHKDTCKPLVLNPEVLQMDRDFRFIDIMITNNSVDFTTEGERTVGKFVVEMRFTNNDLTHFWEDQIAIDAKGNMDLNRYSAEPRHYPGDNIYRIRYEPLEGKVVYSEEITYTSTKKPISFSPVSVTTKITLSEWATYEIQDANGRVIKAGEGREIMLQELKPGEYYIKLQNRFEKFVKK